MQTYLKKNCFVWIEKDKTKIPQTKIQKQTPDDILTEGIEIITTAIRKDKENMYRLQNKNAVKLNYPAQSFPLWIFWVKFHLNFFVEVWRGIFPSSLIGTELFQLLEISKVTTFNESVLQAFCLVYFGSRFMNWKF